MNQISQGDNRHRSRTEGSEVAGQACQLNVNKDLMITGTLPENVTGILKAIQRDSGQWISGKFALNIQAPRNEVSPIKETRTYNPTEILVTRGLNGFKITKIKEGLAEIDLEKIGSGQSETQTSTAQPVKTVPEPTAKNPKKTTSPNTGKGELIFKLILGIYHKSLSSLHESYKNSLERLPELRTSKDSSTMTMLKLVDSKLGKLARQFIELKKGEVAAVLLEKIIQSRKNPNLELEALGARSPYPNLDAVAIVLFRGGLGDDLQKSFQPLEDAITKFIVNNEKRSVFRNILNRIGRIFGIKEKDTDNYKLAVALRNLVDNNYFPRKKDEVDPKLESSVSVN